MTQDAFDALLDWLSPDREEAGRNYQEVRLKLLQRFQRWECFSCSEELVDRTIDRVSETKPSQYSGDPLPYFYRVARFIYLEWHRKPKPEPLPERDWGTDQQTTDKELEYECLQLCLKQLPQESQTLLTEFFQDEKRKKIDRRKQLADRLKLTPNALRIRVHRNLTVLRRCMDERLKRGSH